MAYRSRTADRRAPEWIPADRFVPILEEYLAREDLTNTRTGTGEAQVAGTYPVRETLAKRAGLSSRALHRYLSGESRYISLDYADRLLCAMDKTYLWFTDLSDLYFADVREAA